MLFKKIPVFNFLLGYYFLKSNKKIKTLCKNQYICDSAIAAISIISYNFALVRLLILSTREDIANQRLCIFICNPIQTRHNTVTYPPVTSA